MKITSENINELYDKINTLIDNYFKYNITPKSLSRYFNDGVGMGRFIERNNLKEYDNIEKIIKDVVSDRVAMDEPVMTFENFNEASDKSLLNIDNFNDIEKQRILADFYKTSIGHVSLKNDNSNFYNVKSLKRESEVFILDGFGIHIFLKRVSKLLYNVMLENIVSVPSLNLDISISDIVKMSDHEENPIMKNIIELIKPKIIEIVTEELRMYGDFEFIDSHNGFHIWENKNM